MKYLYQLMLHDVKLMNSKELQEIQAIFSFHVQDVAPIVHNLPLNICSDQPKKNKILFNKLKFQKNVLHYIVHTLH